VELEVKDGDGGGELVECWDGESGSRVKGRGIWNLRFGVGMSISMLSSSLLCDLVSCGGDWRCCCGGDGGSMTGR